MRKIGLVSDTHGTIEPRLLEFFKDCDEIWHAGDIGTKAAADALESVKPLKAVFGNIDGNELRLRFKPALSFQCESLSVYITHIGGYPGHYERNLIPFFTESPPDIFICGHSHILRVMKDKQYGFLYLNPGAAGNSGFHKVKTALRFCINQKDITNMEVLEIKRF